MIVREMKAVIKPYQRDAIDDAIRTAQFIRNRALRLSMNARQDEPVGPKQLYKYCAVLTKKYVFADELNSTATQASAKRAWSAIAHFFRKNSPF